jgi:hypothetical protein
MNKSLFKQPFFYTSLLSLMALGLIIAFHVLGSDWVYPTATPPGGNITLSSGALPSGSAGYVQFASSSTAFGGDASLFWDNTNKRLGIGTASPGQKLSVAGVIESTTGGIKFPDGTVQTTAGSQSCAWCFYGCGGAYPNTVIPGAVTQTWSYFTAYCLPGGACTGTFSLCGIPGGYFCCK